MFRRHYFLILAILIVLAMGAAGAFKIMSKKPSGAGGPGPTAAGPAGGRGGAAGPGGGRGGAGGGALVSATSVSQRVFTDRLDVQGVAKGRQSVTLTAPGGQVVEKVRFKPGEHVKSGQVLIELRRGQEDAGIAQAQAAVDLAKSTADRWNTLAAQGLAPKATAEQYQSAYISAQGSLEAAKARLEDRVIIAPFAGVIGLSDIAPGALISPGTAIATLDDTTVMTVDIDVPDRNLSLVHEGTLIDATSDSYPGEHYAGKIAKIDTRIDERSRSFKARAELPNPGDRLKPGMLLHVGIDRGTHPGLAVPEAAVQYSAGQASVFIIQPRAGAGGGRPGAAASPAGAAQPAAKGPPAAGGAPAGGGPRAGGGMAATAIQRPIVAGIDQCGFVEVKDGLQMGDRIVADGLNKLTPNQPITVGGGRGAPGAPGPGAEPSPGRGDPSTAKPSTPRGPPGPATAGPGRGGMARAGGSPVLSQAAMVRGERCAAQAMPANGPGGPGDRGGRRGPGNADGDKAPGGPASRGRGRGVETLQ